MTTPFGKDIGRLDPGRLADFVVIDHRKALWPYQDDQIPVLDSIMQRAKTQAVNKTVVGGEVIYENGRFTRVDRDQILNEIAEQLSKPRTAEEEQRIQVAQAVFPHVKKFYDGYLDDEKRVPFYASSSQV